MNKQTYFHMIGRGKYIKKGIKKILLLKLSFFSSNFASTLEGTINQAFVKTSTPFWPPKPKELDIAASILTLRATLGITSRSHSGSLFS